jgi:predicted nucleic acid-binding Zn ribbon protein
MCVTGVSNLKKDRQRLKTCHMRWLRTSVNQVNAEQIDSVTPDSHCIMVCELARIVEI